MKTLLVEDNWFFELIGFIGGPGLFLIIGLLLIIVVVYSRFRNKR
ncbi:hypothetical protein [Nonlabens xiamenensis]|nr:hypothetical protein [Nonlabens xiamenensis]